MWLQVSSLLHDSFHMWFFFLNKQFTDFHIWLFFYLFFIFFPHLISFPTHNFFPRVIFTQFIWRDLFLGGFPSWFMFSCQIFTFFLNKSHSCVHVYFYTIHFFLHITLLFTRDFFHVMHFFHMWFLYDTFFHVWFFTQFIYLIWFLRKIHLFSHCFI